MKIGWLIVVPVLIFAVFRALRTHFVCPECGENFKVSVLGYIFTTHFMNKRMVKCPNCGHRGLMEPQWD